MWWWRERKGRIEHVEMENREMWCWRERKGKIEKCGGGERERGG